MTAWIGWKTSRGRSRLGRSCSVGLSEGLTPARSRNVGFAGSGDCSVVAIAVDVSAAAETSDIEVVSDIAGTACSLRTFCPRAFFPRVSGMPSPRSRCADCDAVSACLLRLPGGVTIMPMHPKWRMHGHVVQSRRPLWSKDESYPHVRRVALCGNGSHPVGSLVKGLARSRWIRFSKYHSAGTMDTIFGALTMTLRGSLPPRRSATASNAIFSSSLGSMSGETSSLARTLPLICTTAVTVS